jgi:hypothetical protein
MDMTMKMQRGRATLLLLILAAIGTPVFSHAQQAEIASPDTKATVMMANGESITEEGQGKQFVLTGNSNKVRIKGECQSFTVTGSDNQVELDRVGNINLIGKSNRVSYESALSGDEPVLSTFGSDDRITKRGIADTENKPAPTPSETAARQNASPDDKTKKPEPSGLSLQANVSNQEASPAGENSTTAAGSSPGALIFNRGDETRSESVSDQDVIVNSQGNDLTLSGSVRSLVVNSGDNDVELEKVDRIVLNGDNNHVTYSAEKNKTKPKVVDGGNGNSVTAE